MGPVLSSMVLFTPRQGQDQSTGWAHLERLRWLGTIVFCVAHGGEPMFDLFPLMGPKVSGLKMLIQDRSYA